MPTGTVVIMETRNTLSRLQVTVFLPCHALADLPDWLDESEADAVLAAWTAAWHPAILAATRGLPDWASLDLPWTRSGGVVGVVPPGMADRFQAGAAAAATDEQEFLQDCDPDHLEAALLAACGIVAADSRTEAAWQRDLVADFHSLGLAMLLSERLALRMRTETSLDTSGFPEAVRGAAEAWQAGEQERARTQLAEAFGCLEAARDHYYAVDCWCLDLVLLAASSLAGLDAELDSPAALALLADPETVASLQAESPQLLTRISQRAAAESLGVIGSISPAVPPPLLSAEQLDRELARGRDAWLEAVAVQPQVFAQQAGPVHPLLVQLLPRLGYRGLLWSSFDGGSLPEPGMSRFQWEDGRAEIAAAACKLIDARAAGAVLSLPATLGDAMDHDHTVMLLFCHHAGTASRWFGLLRRAACWTGVFGRFVTPESLLAETADSAGPVRFEPDSFPLRLPPSEPLSGPAASLRAEAERLVAGRDTAAGEIAAAACQLEPHPAAAAGRSSGNAAEGRSAGWLRSWWRPRGDAESLTLSSPGLQLRVHRGTGGIVAFRRGPADRNLLSQQLACCWPDVAAGSTASWRPPQVRYSRMVADAIDRQEQAITSEGRLIDAAGETLAQFRQQVSLVPGLPAAMLEIAVELTAAAAALATTDDPWSRFLACRFAWNENDFCDVFRCLQSQLIATQRQRLCSPWLLVLASEGGGLGRGRGPEAGEVTTNLQLFCDGLPWHLRSSPHTLDTLLATSLQPQRLEARLALGIDLAGATERAISWTAGRSLAVPPLPLPLPAGVRLTAAENLSEPSGRRGLRLQLLETVGEAQPLRFDWSRPIAEARRAGGDPAAEGDVAIVGTALEYRLARREWLDLEIWFRDDHHA